MQLSTGSINRKLRAGSSVKRGKFGVWTCRRYCRKNGNVRVFCVRKYWYNCKFWQPRLECDTSYQPPLGPAVLKPGFDLCVRHLQTLGQSCPLGARQVFLPVEALLQFADLNSGERGAGLFPFGRCPVLVRVSYPPSDGERHQGCCREREREREAPVSGRWDCTQFQPD